MTLSKTEHTYNRIYLLLYTQKHTKNRNKHKGRRRCEFYIFYTKFYDEFSIVFEMALCMRNLFHFFVSFTHKNVYELCLIPY